MTATRIFLIHSELEAIHISIKSDVTDVKLKKKITHACSVVCIVTRSHIKLLENASGFHRRLTKRNKLL